MALAESGEDDPADVVRGFDLSFGRAAECQNAIVGREESSDPAELAAVEHLRDGVFDDPARLVAGVDHRSFAGCEDDMSDPLVWVGLVAVDPSFGEQKVAHDRRLIWLDPLAEAELLDRSARQIDSAVTVEPLHQARAVEDARGLAKTRAAAVGRADGAPCSGEEVDVDDLEATFREDVDRFVICHRQVHLSNAHRLAVAVSSKVHVIPRWAHSNIDEQINPCAGSGPKPCLRDYSKNNFRKVEVHRVYFILSLVKIEVYVLPLCGNLFLSTCQPDELTLKKTRIIDSHGEAFGFDQVIYRT